jgi:hypothetical protein
MPRKPRAINKSAADKKKILEMSFQGLKPSAIQSFFQGKYSYWQIYNTINQRDAKSDKLVGENGKIKEVRIKADKTVTEMPVIDYSDFVSVENFIEHEITVIVSQMNEKKITLEKRVFLLNKISDINKKMKAQQMEKHLKDANAKLIIRIMRRLNSELTDQEIITIYKEESEKLKKLSK